MLDIASVAYMTSAERPLLTEGVLQRLRYETSLVALVRAMREEDRLAADRLRRLSPSQVHLACQRSINALLWDASLGDEALPLDPTYFARAIYGLPRVPNTAQRRRLVRETARIYAQVSSGGLSIPTRPDGFHALWECAMEGEPRWSEVEPSSAFRPAAARIVRGRSVSDVLQVCADPADYEEELEGLLAFFQDTTLEPEIRAACGYALFEWIHPFADGNGHVGRMLALALLQDIYSLPAMVCFSWALVRGRGRTSALFATLRSGEGTLVGFGRGTLEQLHGAQALARGLLGEAEHETAGRLTRCAPPLK